jgi:hypothetical protein
MFLPHFTPASSLLATPDLASEIPNLMVPRASELTPMCRGLSTFVTAIDLPQLSFGVFVT